MRRHVESALEAVVARLDAGLSIDTRWLSENCSDACSSVLKALALEGLIPSALAADDAIGPFRLVEWLGRGATGTVYAAESITQDASPLDRCALKILHEATARDPSALRRLEEETSAGRSVMHPNVVRTYLRGEADHGGRRVHYMALELVDGRALRSVMEEGGPLDEPMCRLVALGAAKGLAAIHAAGLVHRDVKPENLRLASNGVVKVADLGLARTVAPRRDGSRFVGTPRYAAPEQFDGNEEEIDGRADLFALGATLHEMVTGRPPVARDADPAAPFGASRATALAASRWAAEISPFFDDLLASLLEPDKDARLRTADELVNVLERGELGPRRRGRGTVLRGRDDALRSLCAAMTRARNGLPTFALVTGVAGVGKSRLLDEFCAEARRADPSLRVVRLAGTSRAGREVVASPDDGNAAGTLAAARESERATTLVALDDADRADAAALSLIASLGALVDEPVSRRLLVVAGARPAGIDRLSGVCSPSRLERVDLGCLSESALAQVLLDHLWNGPVVDALLPRMAAHSGGNPGVALEALRRARKAGTLRSRADSSLELVAPFDFESSEKVDADCGVDGIAPTDGERSALAVAALFGDTFDPGLVAEACDMPFADLAACLARRAAEGLLLPDGARYRFRDAVQRDRSIAALSDSERPGAHGRIADALLRRRASAGGHEAAILHAHACLHLVDAGRPHEVVDHLDSACKVLDRAGERGATIRLLRAILARKDVLTGGRRVHTLALYASCFAPGSERAELTSTVAEATRLGATMDDPLARCEANVIAATHALAKTDYAGARRLWRLVRRDARRAGDKGLQARGLIGTSMVHQSRGRLRGATFFARRAIEETSGRADVVHVRLQALMVLGYLDLVQRRFDEARAVLDEQVATARQAGETLFALMGERLRADVERDAGRLDDACARYMSVGRAARVLEEPREEAFARLGLGMANEAADRLPEAIDAFERVLVLGRDQRVATMELRASEFLGRVRLRTGDLPGAEALLRRAVDLWSETGIPNEGYLACLWLGLAVQEAGRLDEAASLLRESLRRARDYGVPTAPVRPLLRLGVLEFESGNEALARERFQEARELAHAQRDSAGRTLVELVAADVLAAPPPILDAVRPDELRGAERIEAEFLLWRLAGEKERLRRSHKALLAAADRCGTSVRDAMLANVRLHRRVVEAAADVLAADRRDCASGGRP